MIIDADCHVIECEQTWSLADENEARFAPFGVTSAEGKRYVAIDGRLRPATAGQEKTKCPACNLAGVS